MTTSWHSYLPFFFPLFLCTQRRQRWVSVHHHFFMFFFYAPKEDDDELTHRHHFLFSFCVPREDNNELTLVIILFCFVFMHLEKTMMSRPSSSIIFVFFCAPREDDNESWFVVILFFLFMCTQRRWRQANGHCCLFFSFT